MHYWRLQLLALLAVLHSIASFSHRGLVDGREQCCDRQDDLFRNTRHSYGSNRYGRLEDQDRRLNQRSEAREQRYGARKNEPRLARFSDVRQKENIPPVTREEPIVSRISRLPMRERQEIRRSLSSNNIQSRNSRQDDRRRDFDRIRTFRDRTQNDQRREVRNRFIDERSRISMDSRREIDREIRESRNILQRTRTDVAPSASNDRSQSVDDRRLSRDRVQERREVNFLDYRLDVNRQRDSQLGRARDIRQASRFGAREFRSVDDRNAARDQISRIRSVDDRNAARDQISRIRSESRMEADGRRHSTDNRQILVVSRDLSNEESTYDRRLARDDERRFRTRTGFEGLRTRESSVDERRLAQEQVEERVRANTDERRVSRFETRMDLNREQTRVAERRKNRLQISRESLSNDHRVARERRASRSMERDMTRRAVDDRRVSREHREIRESNRAVNRERLPYVERRVVRDREDRRDTRSARLDISPVSKDRRFATERARLSRSESRVNRERVAKDSRTSEERYSRELDRSRNIELKRSERSITRRDVNDNDRRDLRERSISENRKNIRENLRAVDRRHRSADRLESRESRINQFISRERQVREYQFSKTREDSRTDLVEKARTRQIFLAMTREKLVNQETFTFKWQYLFYTLQGVYLCSLLVQLLSAKESNKKSRIPQWWTMTSPALVHSKVD